MLVSIIVLVYCLVLSLFRVIVILFVFFFFKQKTAYEMRISDWSSDVCSSDLAGLRWRPPAASASRRQRRRPRNPRRRKKPRNRQIGRASCRERVCQYV